jgi:ribosomal protein L37E
MHMKSLETTPEASHTQQLVKPDEPTLLRCVRCSHPLVLDKSYCAGCGSSQR